MLKITKPVCCVFIFLMMSGYAIAAEPLRVLLVIGGGYHDYPTQMTILKEGLESRANMEVDIAYTPTEYKTEYVPKFDGYTGDDWAKGYDVVVHDICSAKSPAEQFVQRVTKAHKGGLPGVFLHCSLFHYRDVETDEWWKLLGVSVCPKHEKIHPLTVANNNPNHPILGALPLIWRTPIGDELYKACKIWNDTDILATGMAGENTMQPVVWTHKYGDGRIVGITIGHHNETVETGEYLDLVTRAVLWAAGNFDENGNVEEEYGLFESITSEIVQ